MPLTVFSVLFWLLCFPQLMYADIDGESAVPAVLVKYRLGGNDTSIQIIDSLDQSPFVLPGTYRIQGQVRLKSKMEKRLEPVQFLQLVRLKSSNGGIDSSENVFTEIWPPGSSGPARVLYKLEGDSDPFNYGDKLVVDYEDIYPDNPTILQVKLAFRDHKQRTTFVALSDFSSAAMDVIKSVDCLQDGFEPRSNIYLARREIGLPGGTVWQYVEDGGITVLQRRFNEIIFDRKAKKQIAGMDLFLRSGTNVERVNLAVKMPGWPFPKRKIFEYPISPRNLTLKNGQIRLRLNLTDYRLKSDDFDQIVLDEVIVFLRREPRQVMRQIPIEKINFLQAKQGEEDAEIKSKQAMSFHLPEVKILGHGRKQLVLDILELKSRIERLTSFNSGQQRVADYRLSQVELKGKPKNQSLFGGIRVNRVFTVNEMVANLPIIITKMRELIKKWGGPFLEPDVSLYDSHFEWLNILDYISFKEAKYFKRSLFHHDDLIPIETPNGLLLRSGSSSFTFTWTTSIPVNGASRFILRAVPQGTVNRLVYVFTNQAGSEYKVQGILNQPVCLPEGLGDVKSVYVKLDILGQDVAKDSSGCCDDKYHRELLLQEAVFFNPTIISITKLWEAPLLVRLKRSLVPVFKETGSERSLNGFYAIVPLGEVSEWTTLIERPARKIVALEVMAKVPRQFFTEQPCWLELTVHGTNHSVSHDLCFPAAAGGRASLDMEALLVGSGFAREEMIRDITWKISGDPEYGQKYGALRFLLTERNATLSGLLVNEPSFSINGIEYFGLKQGADYTENCAKLYFGNLYFDNTEGEMPRIKFSPLASQYFAIDSLTVERTAPITISQWQMLRSLRRDDDDRVEDGHRGIVFKVLVLLGACVLIWGGVRFGVLKKIWTAISWGWEMVHKTVFLGWHPAIGLQLVFWLIVTVLLYIFGLLDRGQRGENYFFTFGGIAAVLAWRAYVFRARDWLHKHRPGLAKLLYGGEGSHYFAGAIFLLIITAFLVALRIEAVAERVAVIVYYMLVAGVFRELRCQLKNSGDSQGVS